MVQETHRGLTTAVAVTVTVGISKQHQWRNRFIKRFLIPIVLLIVFANVEQLSEIATLLIGEIFSDTIKQIQNFLKLQSQGFLVILGIGIYFEFVSIPRSVEIESSSIENIANRLRIPPSDMRPSQQLENYISNLYPGTNVSTLVKTIFSDKSPMLDTDVEIELCDSSDDNEMLEYTLNISYRGDISKFILALASDTKSQESASKIPEVQFSRALPKSFSSIDCADAYAKNIDISTYSGNTKTSLKLSPLSQKEYISLLSPLLLDVGIGLRLYKIMSNISGERRIFISFPTVKLRKDCYYVFWFADRPLFLRKITLDASKLRSFDRNRFNFHCNILSATSMQSDYKKTGKLSVQVENWATYGQGVIFSWR